MKYKLLVATFIIVSGCRTTDNLSVNLLSERIRLLESSMVPVKSNMQSSDETLVSAINVSHVDSKNIENISKKLEIIQIEIFGVKDQIINLNKCISEMSDIKSEIINLNESISEMSDIKSEIINLNESIDKERLLRIEIEKSRNPREYKQYLEVRKLFE